MTSPTPRGPTPPSDWLVLIYRVPADPASRRTFVWRRLKGLGAVYLQQAAAILPATADVRAALTDLARRITDFGGEASLLETTAPDEAWAAALVARFNHERDTEYGEVIATAKRLEDEVRRETDREKFSFAELEEIEADWARIRRWHARVRERDRFTAPAGPSARAALVAARGALDGFQAEVYRREGLGAADEAPLDKDEPD